MREARKQKGSAFSAISPLFLAALEQQKGQNLDFEKAANSLRPTFGDNFNVNVLECFADQLVKEGWLIPRNLGPNKAAYLVSSSLPEIDATETSRNSLEKLDALYEKFRVFVGIKAPLLNLTISKDEFRWELFRWATSLDGSDKTAIRSEAERLVAGGVANVDLHNADEVHKFSRIDRRLSVEFAAFVKWLYKNSPNDLDLVSSITELGLALEFLQELRQPSLRRAEKLDLILVFDAPVLLDILGMSGPAREKSIKSIMASLKHSGCRFITLSHCVEEMTNILKTVLETDPSKRFGPTGDILRSDKILQERARSIIMQPDKHIKQLDLSIQPFDRRRSPSNENYFSSELIDKFRSSATWHDQTKTVQKERDACSVGFVMRRRAGSTSSDILDCKIALVTRNAMFTEFSLAFCRRELDISEYDLGPCIEVKTLGANVWLRMGQTDATNLPQLHLIAACDKILSTNQSILRKAYSHVKNIVTPEQAQALLESEQAVLDLVISTGGSIDIIDSANSEELLSAFMTSSLEEGKASERRVAKEEIATLTTELNTIRNDLKSTKGQLSSAAMDNSLQALKLQALEKSAEDEKRAVQNRQQNDAQHVFDVADRRAYAFMFAAAAFIGIIAFCGQFFIWDGIEWWAESLLNILIGSLILLSCLITMIITANMAGYRSVDLFTYYRIKLRSFLLERAICRHPRQSEQEMLRLLIGRLESDNR